MSRVRIVSNGSSIGTRVEVDGQLIPCAAVTWTCRANNELATAFITVHNVEVDVVAPDVILEETP